MQRTCMYTRAMLVLAVMLGILGAGTALAAEPPAKDGSKAAVSKAQPERKGYSIFRETMVDMSWPEIRKAAEADALVILPVGVIEEHGPHMSLGADTYLVYEACKMLKHRLAQDGIQSVIVPPVYWGVMQTSETGKYPGSFTVQPSTMKALLKDILADVKSWGFRRVFPANFHGDRVHRQTFREAMDEARKELGLDIFDDKAYGGPRPTTKPYKVENPYKPDFHAGAQETAEMLRFFPEEVDLKLAATLKPEDTFHPLGYVGDPANHSNANPVLEGIVEPVAGTVKKWMSGEKQPQQP